MEILCFFSGVAFAYFRSVYALGLICLLFYFRQSLFYLIYFLLGMTWAMFHQAAVSPKNMPIEPVISQAKIVGIINSVPSVSAEKTQFELNLVSLNARKVKAKILVSCFKYCPLFSVGQKWQMQVKLKKPQNLGNPGGYDLVSSLHARHIDWVGYTKGKQFKLLSDASGLKHLIEKERTYFANQLNQQHFSVSTQSILQALTLGFGNQINAENWSLFRRTGTSHLMVISGAHIGFVAGITYSLLKYVWSRFSFLAIRVPAQRFASVFALIVAMIYSVMAGFGVPAERAFVMCFFMFFRYLYPVSFTTWQAYRYALLFVLLFEPHAVLMPGFYLSFIAVAVIIIANQMTCSSGIMKTLRIQLLCLIGLTPLTLYFFSYGSLNGFLANIVAIPWVGFVIIPIGLLMVFAGGLLHYDILVRVLDFTVTALLKYLQWIDKLAFMNFDFSLNELWRALVLMFAFLIAYILPLKRFFPVVLVLIVSSLYVKPTTLRWGEAFVDVLDVAQGLSVVIRTAQHILVYDTGMKFYRGRDMGDLAIIPYLKTLRIKLLDMVIISHPDLDHRGGLESLEKQYHIRSFLVDDPGYYHRGESCHDYPPWYFDGVQFEFLPMPVSGRKKNDHSCVLKIKTDYGSVLLTGDIEKTGEQYLVKNYPNLLSATYLLVPHHASKSSSSIDFLQHITPSAAIASYGFDNQYHFPHAQTLLRYQQQHIPFYATQTCGLIRMRLTAHYQGKLPECTKFHKVVH